MPDRIAELRAEGHRSDDGLFEALAGEVIERKESQMANRCFKCWHDAKQGCICTQLPALSLRVRVRILVLMHHKEYLGAGDDAKLLMAMLPPDQARLFVYGRARDWVALAEELAADPAHSLILWPGDGALTIDEFISALPESSAWRRSGATPLADAAADGETAAGMAGLSLGETAPAEAGTAPPAEGGHAPYCDCGCVPSSLSLMEMARLRRERRARKGDVAQVHKPRPATYRLRGSIGPEGGHQRTRKV